MNVVAFPLRQAKATSSLSKSAVSVPKLFDTIDGRRLGILGDTSTCLSVALVDPKCDDHGHSAWPESKADQTHCPTHLVSVSMAHHLPDEIWLQIFEMVWTPAAAIR